MVKKDN